MDTLETISQRLNTTREIQSIVRVMKSLSAVSINQYETAVHALDAYRHTNEQGLQIVLKDYQLRSGKLPNELFENTTGERIGLVVIGSDRGMCGRFNEAIATFAHNRLQSARNHSMLCIAGLRTASRLQSTGHEADRLISLPGSVEGLVETAQSILIEIDRWQTQAAVQTVHVLHNRRGQQSRVLPTAMQLAPVPSEDLVRLANTAWPGPSLPHFSMPANELLSWLIRQRVFLGVYAALAESLASEHTARLAAMQAAERNIEEQREEIESSYRRKRQETITSELMDIVAGFEASVV